MRTAGSLRVTRSKSTASPPGHGFQSRQRQRDAERWRKRSPSRRASIPPHQSAASAPCHSTAQKAPKSIAPRVRNGTHCRTVWSHRAHPADPPQPLVCPCSVIRFTVCTKTPSLKSQEPCLLFLVLPRLRHYKAKCQNKRTVDFCVVLQCKHFSGNIKHRLQTDGYLQIPPQIRKIPLSSRWTLHTRYNHNEHSGSHTGAAAGASPRILNTKRHTKHVKQKCLSFLWIPVSHI